MHYLMFAEGDIPSGATQYKCAPPLRDEGNRESLRAATGATIAMVSSDHSPAPDSLKALESGSFLDAWGGIRGLQYSLPALNTLARVRSMGTAAYHVLAQCAWCLVTALLVCPLPIMC